MKADKTISYINKEGHIESGKSTQNAKKKNQENEFDYLRYANIGFYLVTPLLAGVFLGLKLDEWFNTKPLFIISGILLGTIACMYNLFKLTKDA